MLEVVPGAAVDLSHRGVISVSGPDRLGGLHSLTTQYLEGLTPGLGVTTLVLSPQGHIEHALYGVDDGETFWAHTEPGAAPSAVAWLDRMRFMMRVEVADRTADFAIVWRPDLEPEIGALSLSQDAASSAVARTPSVGTRSSVFWADLAVGLLAGTLALAGTWAYEARRISTGVPRIGVDSDHRTIPNELGLLGPGRPPGEGLLPRSGNRGAGAHARPTAASTGPVAPRRRCRSPAERGAALWLGPGGRFRRRFGRHYELGPIALGLVKRNVPDDRAHVVDSIAAAQELLVDPEIGLHVRARLRTGPDRPPPR